MKRAKHARTSHFKDLPMSTIQRMTIIQTQNCTAEGWLHAFQNVRKTIRTCASHKASTPQKKPCARNYQLVAISQLHRSFRKRRRTRSDISWCFWDRSGRTFIPDPQDKKALCISLHTISATMPPDSTISESLFGRSFGRLVLGRIKTHFCKQVFILQHFRDLQRLHTVALLT